MPLRGTRSMLVAGVALAILSCSRTSSAVRPAPAAPDGDPSPGQPLDKSRPAREVYRNIKLFTRDDVSAEFFDELMEGISRDLGVSCLHCHEPGALHESDLGPRKRLARETIPVMWSLVAGVNGRYFQGQGGPVRCWTCHRGSPAPQRSPPGPGDWTGSFVDLTRRDDGPPAGSNLQVLHGIGGVRLQQAMLTIAASLGVACEACHLVEDPASDEKPLKVAARGMIAMTVAIDGEYFEPGRGPTCWTCHRGSLAVETTPAGR